MLETFCDKGAPLLGASALDMATPPGRKTDWVFTERFLSLTASFERREYIMGQTVSEDNHSTDYTFAISLYVFDVLRWFRSMAARAIVP